MSAQAGRAPIARTWEEQWARVQRWHDRFKAINDGRQHDLPADNYQDDVYAFFQNAYHLKDWLKNDPSSPLPGGPQSVEDFINYSTAMQWCADLANGTKHLRVDRKRGADPNVGVASRNFSLTVGNEGTETTLAVSYTIVAAGQSKDGWDLANECMVAWRRFLRGEGLIS